MLRLKEESKDRGICVQDLVDGQVAIITEWTVSFYLRRVVQRYKDNLIVLGGDSGDCWSEIFTFDRRWEDCRVRVLQPGTTLVIE